MGLVTPKEVSKAIHFEKFGFLGTFVGWGLLWILRISKINNIYDKYKHLNGDNFLNAILKDLEVNFEVPEQDLKRIPAQGAFITVSNHPLGGIDGVLLLKLLTQVRPDYKIIANFLLQRIRPLSNFVMPVNPFENYKNAKSSVIGIKNTFKHLEKGYPLGIFPAGEVSTYKDGKLIIDKPWEESAVKLIKHSKVPVIPIYFHGKNSRLFYGLSKISSTLRTLKLPSELLRQKGRVIKVRIGKPITVKMQEQYPDISSFNEFLRKKTYMLSNPYQDKTSNFLFNSSLKISKAPKKIVQPKNQEQIVSQVEALRGKEEHLFTSKNYEVYFAQAKQINNVLHEIGRLREITFREIGAGTNESIDLDEFDQYYRHLFLWDKENKKLIGAYRVGLGSYIYKNKGIEGFYVTKMFRFDSEMHSMLGKSIDMGRAFVIKDYQQKPLPLFLLWKGIGYIILHYPEHKYLTGGVSISNQFSNFTKSLMIEFMKSHYYDPYLAQYIHPKKEYKVKLKDEDKDFIFDTTKADLNKFDKIIDEIEPKKLRLPVLIKKYIKQNARLVSFNVDPVFNNAIDGLIFMRIADLPESSIKPIMEEFQLEVQKNNTKK